MRVYCRFAPTRPDQHVPGSLKCLHIAVDTVKNESTLSCNPSHSSKKSDICRYSPSYKVLTVAEVSSGASISIGCDEVFFPVPECTQSDVFESITAPLLDAVLYHGMNRSLLAYGQTSTGKTHTMFGPDGGNTMYFDSVDSRGIVPRLGEAMFGNNIGHEAGDHEVERVTAVDVRYYEIYNEQLTDLVAKALVEVYGGVDTSSTAAGCGKVKTVSQSKHQYQVTFRSTEKAKIRRSLQKITCRSASELNQLLCKLTDMREIKNTESNLKSSRSHVVLQLTVAAISSQHRARSITPVTKDRCVPQSARRARSTAGASHHRLVVGGQLTIADLAGSESLRGLSGINSKFDSRRDHYSSSVDIFEKPYVTMKIQQESKMRIQETKNINTSLFALKKVVHALHVGDVHIPFKDSMLTVALEDALQPESALITCCSSEGSDIAETFATLRFASEASKISPPPAMVNIHNQAVTEEQHSQKRLQEEMASKQRESDSEAIAAISVMRRTTSTGTEKNKGTEHQRMEFSRINKNGNVGSGRGSSSECHNDNHQPDASMATREGSPCISCPDEYVIYESGTPLPNIEYCDYKGDCVQKRMDHRNIIYVNSNGKPVKCVREELRLCDEEDDCASSIMKNNTYNTMIIPSTGRESGLRKALDDANKMIITLQEQYQALSNAYELVVKSLKECEKEKELMQEEHEANMNTLKVELSCLRNELFLAESCTNNVTLINTNQNIDTKVTHDVNIARHRSDSIPSVSSLLIKEELVRQSQLSVKEETAVEDVLYSSGEQNFTKLLKSTEKVSMKGPSYSIGECDDDIDNKDTSTSRHTCGVSGHKEDIQRKYTDTHQCSERVHSVTHCFPIHTHHNSPGLSLRYPLTDTALASAHVQMRRAYNEKDEVIELVGNIIDSCDSEAESFITTERRLWSAGDEESVELDDSHDQHAGNNIFEPRMNHMTQRDSVALVDDFSLSRRSEDPPSPVSAKMNESCFGVFEKEKDEDYNNEEVTKKEEKDHDVKDGVGNSHFSHTSTVEQLNTFSNLLTQIPTTIPSNKSTSPPTVSKKASETNPLRSEIAKILGRPLRTTNTSRPGLLSDVANIPSSLPMTSHNSDYGYSTQKNKDRQTRSSGLLTTSLMTATNTETEMSSFRTTNENKENETIKMPRFTAYDSGIDSKAVDQQTDGQQSKQGGRVLSSVSYSAANANQPHHPSELCTVVCTNEHLSTPVQNIKPRAKEHQQQRERIVKVFSPQSAPD